MYLLNLSLISPSWLIYSTLLGILRIYFAFRVCTYFDLFASRIEGKPRFLFLSVAFCFCCKLGGRAQGRGVPAAAAQLPGLCCRCPARRGPLRAIGCREPAVPPWSPGEAASAPGGSCRLLPSPRRCVLPAAGLYSLVVRAVRSKIRDSTVFPCPESRKGVLSVPALNVVVLGTEKHVRGSCRAFLGRKAQVVSGSPLI